MKKIRVGTRASDLALAQSHLVAEALKQAAPGVEIEIVHIQTLGDSKQGTPEAGKLDKKAWILELEQGLASGEIDLAVHSGKDVPGDISPATVTLPILPRENPFDAFIGRKTANGRVAFDELPPGASVGTSSLRRKACLAALRPDLQLVDLRGNVPTRIRKLDEENVVDGIVIACAGLHRLGLAEIGYFPFSAAQMPPALSQGSLVAQFASHAKDLERILYNLVDPSTRAAFIAERTCAELLDIDCSSAVGIYCATREPALTLFARILSPDGAESIEVQRDGVFADARLIGESAAKELLQNGAARLLHPA